MVKRFIAGDTLQQAMTPTEELLARGILISLDYLGENTTSEQEAMDAKKAYLEILEACKSSSHYRSADPKGYKEGHVESINLSIKLTQCGFDISDEFAEKCFRDVVATAGKDGNFVRVDMEGSPYTERTVQIIERVHKDMPNCGTVLQSYLYRTDEDIKRLTEQGVRLRIVKGAYLEPKEVAIPEKSKVDEAYVKQAKWLLKNGVYPAIATHDADIITELKKFIEAEKIDKNKFEFQMIYGVRRDLCDQVLAEGYRIRVYVPYGDAWYPYFTRRLAERPANVMFIAKSLVKG